MMFLYVALYLLVLYLIVRREIMKEQRRSMFRWINWSKTATPEARWSAREAGYIWARLI